MGPIATIDLSALQHNLQQVKQLAPKSKVIAVIKSNAYGHGAIQAAKALSEADAFAVARVEEAIELRDVGIDGQLVVLEGFSNEQELQLCIDHDIECVFHQQYQIDFLLNNPNTKSLKAWFKLDTGMHRLGFQIEQADQAYAQLVDYLHEAPKLLSHLASADEVLEDKTQQQVKEFKQFQADASAERSCANSAGIIAWPESHYDWVRPGIMLYGSSPFSQQHGEQHGLKPVMTLKSQIIAINQIAAGETIGYGGTWVCDEPTKVGVIAMGYGDGYPRHVAEETCVLIKGKRVSIIGRVSMDMITIDLTNQDDVQINDEVILWGEGLPAEEIAEQAGTISYELFCQMTRRVKVEYVG